MAERNKSHLRGFLVPFPFTKDDIVYGFGNTTFNKFNPYPDVPTPSDDTKLFVGASGQALGDTDIQIVTSRAGNASSAEYRVRNNQLSTSIEYGNNQSSLITDWLLLAGETVSYRYFQNDIINDENGGYITAYEKKTLFTNQLSIECKEVDLSGNITTSLVTNIEITTGLFGSRGKPSLVRMPDDSILCFVSFVESDNANLNAYRSTDNGNNWNLVASSILDEEIDVSSSKYTIERISAEYAHGQILLVISAYSAASADTYKNHLLQYASIDGGATFKLVTGDPDTYSFKSIQVFKIKNQLALAYVAATDELHVMKMPHAFFQAQSLRAAGKFVKCNPGGSSGDFASGTDTNMTSGWISAFIRPENSFYVFAKDVSDDSIVCCYSIDHIDFYGLLPNASPSSQPSVFFGDNTECINTFNLCSYQGGAVMVHDWTTTGNGDSVAIAYLGGFATIVQPIRNATSWASIPIYRGQSTFGYLPFYTAASSSELTKSGTGTESLVNDYLQLQVTTSQTDILFERHKTSVLSNTGITVRGVVTVTNTDNGNAPTICEIELEQSGGDYWKLKVVMEEDSFEVFDTSPLTPVSLLTQSFNCDDGFEYIMSISPSGKACFYYRNSGYASLKEFVVGFKNRSLTTVSTGISNDIKMTFGIDGSPTTGIAESRWSQVFCLDQNGYADISDVDTEDLLGLKYSTTAYQYIKDGVSIIAKVGPTYIGDDFNIKSTSANSIDNLFHLTSPSPRVPWKSDTVTSGSDVTTQRISLELSTNSTDLGNDIVGLHLANINFRDAQLQYWDGAAWQTVFAFETSSGMKHGYTRQGRTIRQDNSNVFDRSYYFYNELKDYIAMLVSGENTAFFRVQSNTEGVFGDGTSKLCIITLDDEPSFNGTLYLIPTNVTVVCSLNGADGNRWALNLPAQKTIDDQFQIGNLYLGALAITGTQYSKGRRINIDSGNIVSVSQDKTRYSRDIAPQQRTVQISWSDGIDQSTFYDNPPDPDYFKSSSSGTAQPVSVYQDAPYLMEGILRELKGSHIPMVYLPSITTSSDNRVYNRRDQHLCGVIDSDIAITSITGDELIGDGTGEVFRVGTITILEVV